MSIVLLWIAAQIITESFPVSSSSHTKLLELLLSWRPVVPLHFDDFLHIPTLFILAIFFFPRWYPLLCHAIRFNSLFLLVVGRTILASVITVLFYFFFNFIPLPHYFPMTIGLFITTGALFSLRWCTSRSYGDYTWHKAFLLGVAQGIALLPGISRLGITFVCARWLGLSPRHSAEASFAMQVPLLFAACARGTISLISYPYMYEVLNARTSLVMIVSGVIAYAGLCFFMYLARVHKVWLFAWYMIIPLMTWLLFFA
jgi:undecaprenyl-diphosphatase